LPRIARRSSNALIDYMKLIDWTPTRICMVGVGVRSEEPQAFLEAWPQAMLIGLEPNPDTFTTIDESFPGVLLPAAASDKSGWAVLHSKTNWKDGSTVFPFEDASHRHQVQTVRLDHIVTIHEQDKFLLWLDCEGSELLALQGAHHILEDVQVINVEMTGKPRIPGWCSPKDVHNLLLCHGFTQCWVHTIRPPIAQFDAIYVRNDLVQEQFSSCIPS